MENFLQDAKESSRILSTLSGREKNRILREMAQALRANSESLVNQNKKDMEDGEKNNLSSALMDRLFLDESRIDAMAVAIEEIATLKEPVGKVLDGWVTEDGLKIEKVSIPIGVIGIIYESRPNVTSDTAALCFKSSNVCILKGGKEAEHSNRAIAKILQDVLEKNALPKALVSLIPDSSRAGVDKLIKMDKYVDLIIPRGGAGLIKHVSENATVSVVKHDKGQCHTYIDKDAKLDNAIAIALNAKVQRPGVCNAMETLLIHHDIAQQFIPLLADRLVPLGVEFHADDKFREICPEALVATEDDWHAEYLDLRLAVRVVDSIEQAMDHIATYGSGHSDAIVSGNAETCETFLNLVDTSTVYANASTRFTDGQVFGMGAEIGISTDRIHARGPMGVVELTTYKYQVRGEGQIRE